MLCSGCGKDIPFTGQVCPYCQRDKSGDQRMLVVAIIIAAPLGYIGYLLFGLGGMVGGVLLGGVIGVVIANPKATSPPEVRVSQTIAKNKNSARIITDPSMPPFPVLEAQPIEIRLAKLLSLRDKGLLDDAEYKLRRRSIIDEV